MIAHKNYIILIIDPNLGSHHPFILQYEAVVYIKKWTENSLVAIEIKAKIYNFCYWIYQEIINML